MYGIDVRQYVSERVEVTWIVPAVAAVVGALSAVLAVYIGRWHLRSDSSSAMDVPSWTDRSTMGDSES